MPTLERSSGASASGGLAGALKAFAEEASVLLQALLRPGKVIDEVEQMRALQVRANRIEEIGRAHV